MALEAQTTASFMLRLLFLTTTATGQRNLSVESVAGQLAKAQEARPDVQVYPFPSEEPWQSPQLWSDLEYLEDLALVTCKRDNPHVSLTALGRLFSQLVALPSEVEDYFKAAVSS